MLPGVQFDSIIIKTNMYLPTIAQACELFGRFLYEKLEAVVKSG